MIGQYVYILTSKFNKEYLTNHFTGGFLKMEKMRLIKCKNIFEVFYDNLYIY